MKRQTLPDLRYLFVSAELDKLNCGIQKSDLDFDPPKFEEKAF